MSRIYFHSPSGTAELRGSERHHLGALVNDIATGALHVESPGMAERLMGLLPAGHWMTSKDTHRPGWMIQWASRYALALRAGDSPLIQYQGKTLSTFSLALNTALALGNDPVKLAARIHGQCEIHAWVDGPNRAWLAGIMQSGIDSGVYRKGFWFERGPGGERAWSDQGWDQVIELLRSRDDEPVVMSYSVCGSFPNDEHSNAWYDLDDTEKWRISMAGLRASDDGLEISPDDWAAFRFTHELSVLDLRAADWEQRVQKALGLEPVAPQGLK